MEIEQLHNRAQSYSAEAAAEASRGNHVSAVDLFRQAATLELEAFRLVPQSEPRTRTGLGISAASLLYKANRLEDAETEILQMLAGNTMLPSARVELVSLLQATWDAKAVLASGFEYAAGSEIWVSLRDGEIGSGTAPVETALHYLTSFNSIVNRTAELESGAPFRVRGAPSKEIRDIVLARATQPVAGSYRFSIRLADPKQPRLLPDDKPLVRTKSVATSFIEIVRCVASADIDQMRALVPDDQYRGAMMRLVRNVIPLGKAVGEVEVAIGGEPEKRVLLFPDQRSFVTQAIKTMTSGEGSEASDIVGTLRAVHLDKNWIEIALDNGARQIVRTKHDTLDEVIGPFVNRRVRATVSRQKKQKTPVLNDLVEEE